MISAEGGSDEGSPLGDGTLRGIEDGMGSDEADGIEDKSCWIVCPDADNGVGATVADAVDLFKYVNLDD